MFAANDTPVTAAERERRAESDDSDAGSGPFEGPEKLLEIWFAPAAPVANLNASAATVADVHASGLRIVSHGVREDVLNIVKCKALNVVRGSDMDAYLLRSAKIPLEPLFLAFLPTWLRVNITGLIGCLSSRLIDVQNTSLWVRANLFNGRGFHAMMARAH